MSSFSLVFGITFNANEFLTVWRNVFCTNAVTLPVWYTLGSLKLSNTRIELFDGQQTLVFHIKNKKVLSCISLILKIDFIQNFRLLRRGVPS